MEFIKPRQGCPMVPTLPGTEGFLGRGTLNADFSVNGRICWVVVEVVKVGTNSHAYNK